ncbi:flocculation protein FLO11-like [Venturia canescens]|uniref:flocculation protein FLO11-like n=1 Tax=Venturia canescens TaxID=32260 RepID=UPI001C9C1AF9|nr:flocculation protein FLO11-like [Venturia canescens]
MGRCESILDRGQPVRTVIASIVQFQHGSTLCSAGEPGYLDFDNLPETNFSCHGKVIGGYYADVETGCQMFHVCTIGQKDEKMDIKFLCLNGTVFDQETRVCERVDEVDCSKSERFYNLNLELYGNNAVTLSLHDLNPDDEDDGSEVIDESHESQRTSSSRPSTTSTTTTTTQRAIVPSTTAASGAYQHPSGYPQHYQPQPRFPSVQTSQSKSLYDDKNGGYHHQYIYHTGDHRTNNLENNNDGTSSNNNNQNPSSNNNNNNNNNQATSYQLFSNQGVGSTTASPQIHEIRYSSTAGPQIQIRNDHQPTVAPIFHATSSTIQTLLNSNANSPALINPIFHNHGIASTTEQFTVHNNNPRETEEYRDNEEEDNDNEESQDDRRPLEAIQPTTQGKISKLKISPISVQQESVRAVQRNKEDQLGSDPHRITTSFLATSNNNDHEPQTVRSFYPTPRTSTKSSSSHVTQHIHVPPLPSIPQLKPHQVTINLSPPDIQRIVQNPSPLLPSQSRVIVTAKASVSDESGRPLNSTQLVTLPLPTIPTSYDDYKEGDESFDPFYRDVPKIRNNRKAGGRFHWPARELREERSARTKRDLTVEKTEDASVDRGIKIIHEKSTEGNFEIDSTTKPDDDQASKSHAEPNLPQVIEDPKPMSSGHLLDSDYEEKTDSGQVTDSFDDSEATKSANVEDEKKHDAGEHPNGSDATFNRKIFDDPEAHTSKDVDTRAIGHGSKYSKDYSKHYDQDAKTSRTEGPKTLQSSGNVVNDESSRFSLELPEVVDSSEPERKHSSKKLHFEEETRNESGVEEKESNRESQMSEEEYPNDDDYYDSEMDSSSVRSDEEDSVEYSKEYSPNKIQSSRHHKSFDRAKVPGAEDESGESRDRNRSNNQKDENYEDDYELSDASTTRSNEEVTSYEMSSEYADTERSQESSHEVRNDEEDISMSHDHTTMSQETISDDSQEVGASTEKMGPLEHPKSHEDSEGVLKFTDEIPILEEMDEPEAPKNSGRPEAMPQDYIDDNYEPQSYKEKETTTTDTGITGYFEELTTIQAETDKPEKAEISSTETVVPTDRPKDEENSEENKQSDEPQTQKKLDDQDPVEKSIGSDEPEEIPTTTPSSMTKNATTAPTSTTSTSTTTTSTTTTTTTPRPTPPKLFKPFTLRKSYVYVPPSTTPVPVVIKPRMTLLNPKPAKPPKSYNDYAPKPVIRKTLFARKFPPTSRITTPRVEEVEPSTEIPATMISDVEESTSSIPVTETPTEIPEAPSTTTVSTAEPDRSVKAEENYVSASTTQVVEASSTTYPESFTPWPLLRASEGSSTSANVLAKNEEIEGTTSRNLDLENNDVPRFKEPETASTTLQASTSTEYAETTSQAPISTSTEPAGRNEKLQIEPSSDSTILENNVAVIEPKVEAPSSTTVGQVTGEPTTENPTAGTTIQPPDAPTEDTTTIESTTLVSVQSSSRKPGAIKRIASFNCLEKEMYRYYADGRDCRLFHYCAPGFTSRQVLDFRFVCEEGTSFDEESQSCVHDLNNPKCRKRVW